MNDFAQVPDAIAALRAGRPVLVLDDTERENEGDVILAAELATAEWLAWTIRHTSGYLCAPLPDELLPPAGLDSVTALRPLPAGLPSTVPLGPVTAKPTTPASPTATSTLQWASGGFTMASCQARVKRLYSNC